MTYLKGSIVCAFLFSLPAFAGSSVQGIKNFYEVDSHVYRGAQPSDSGFEYLAKLGVKTVVDLRESGDRASQEEQEVTALGMKYINVPMSGLTPPTQAQTSEILGLLEDNSTGPVFVHCMRGADRTGAIIGAYRVDHDHWSNDRALSEAKEDGMGFFQGPREDYIRNFQPRVIEASNVTVAKSVSAGVVSKVPVAAVPASALPATGAVQ